MTAVLVRMVLVVRFVAIVMQSHAVEFLERIRNLVSGRGKARIQRYTLQLARAAVANIDTVRLLHITEVQSIDTAALVGDDRWLRVAEQSPRGAAEEGMILHVGCTGAGTQAAEFILDEKLADQGLAEARSTSVS
jgi:hypothetical protein